MNQELLYKYFKGITSVEEEKMILDWIDASDENRNIFLKERMIYDISLFSDKQGNNEKKTVRIMPMLRWAARIAAVTIVAIAGYFITSDFLYNKEVQLQTVTVPAGQRAQITLADRNTRMAELQVHHEICRQLRTQRTKCGIGTERPTLK